MATLSGRQKIIVKTPLSADGKDDFTMEVSSQWNVRQLKEVISKDLPRKPDPNDLKLIFSGSVLSDAILLKDCFRSVTHGSLPVIHLVCKPIPFVVSPVSTGSSSDNQNEGLHRRTAVPQSQPFSPIPVNSFNFNPWQQPIYDQAHMTQYYQSYQAYLQQYMYSQMTMNSMIPPGAAHLPQPPQATAGNPGAGNHIRMNQPAEFNIANIPEMAGGVPVADQPAGAGMNAQGGAAIVDEDGEQRDAFDWVYIVFRVAALFFAIGITSTTSRFFSAFTMLSIFLLFNTIRDFRRWRERQLRRNLEPPAVEANPPPVNREAAAEGVVADGERQNAEAVPAPVVPEPEAGFLSTVLSVMISFFTSLVPDVQGVVA